MRVDPARLHVVLQLDVEDVDDLPLDVRVEDREGGLDAPTQVAPHPICRSEIKRFLPVVVKIPNTGVLEKHVHDARNPDIPAIRLVRDEAADTAYDQVDVHARLARPVEGINHVRVVKSIHLENDAPLASRLGVFDFPGNQAVQFGYHIKACYQQMTERRGGKFSFEQGKDAVHVEYEWSIRQL